MTAPAGADYAGRAGLRGWTMDLLAHYYFARNKTSAALSYMHRAMAALGQISTLEGRAAWKAHMAVLLSGAERHDEALEFAKEALADVVGTDQAVLTEEAVRAGLIPHAHRRLAAALCFNLAVAQCLRNQVARPPRACAVVQFGPWFTPSLSWVCSFTPSPRTKWTRRVPHPVLIGHAASGLGRCALPGPPDVTVPRHAIDPPCRGVLLRKLRRFLRAARSKTCGLLPAPAPAQAACGKRCAAEQATVAQHIVLERW